MKKESIISLLKIFFYPLIIIWKYSSLRNKITFSLEGNIDIELIPTNIFSLLNKQKISHIENNFALSKRVYSEALLRSIVFELIQKKIISKNEHIVDIGSWIGDNSIIWGRLIEDGTGKIYAIDPSPSNIDYGKRLEKINSVLNICWNNEVCSSKDGLEIFYNGNINHCDFNNLGLGKKYFKKTNTIDSIVGNKNWHKISMLHLDVEGLEEEVLIGSMNIISHSRPIIIFEQHISDINPNEIFSRIKHFDYELYMINEVLPESRLDTRNFIAFQKDTDVSIINEISPDSVKGCWPATTGQALIKVK